MPLGAEPREQILNAASILFVRQGFGATTTRQVATAAGLEQGSLFHYFPRKDDLLAELLDRTLSPPLEFASWLDGAGLPSDQKLFLIAYRQTFDLCAEPYNLASLVHLPEIRLPQFAAFWSKRQTLKETYQRYIVAGVTDGVFTGIETDFAFELVFAMVESGIDWFDRGRDDPARAAVLVATAALQLLHADRLHIQDMVRDFVNQLDIPLGGADDARNGRKSSRRKAPTKS